MARSLPLQPRARARQVSRIGARATHSVSHLEVGICLLGENDSRSRASIHWVHGKVIERVRGYLSSVLSSRNHRAIGDGGRSPTIALFGRFLPSLGPVGCRRRGLFPCFPEIELRANIRWPTDMQLRLGWLFPIRRSHPSAARRARPKPWPTIAMTTRIGKLP